MTKEQINLSEWVLAAREYAGPEMTQEKISGTPWKNESKCVSNGKRTFKAIV